MKNKLSLLTLLLLKVILSGCASMSSNSAPKADMDALETFYVQKLPADERGIEKVISNQLVELGYQSSYCSSEKPPTDVDAIVTYQDKWMWDITMYMIELNMQIWEGDKTRILASGKTYRPSLQRKSPETMAKELLTDMLKK